MSSISRSRSQSLGSRLASRVSPPRDSINRRGRSDVERGGPALKAAEAAGSDGLDIGDGDRRPGALEFAHLAHDLVQGPGSRMTRSVKVLPISIPKQYSGIGNR
jgi:hypothetical protein